MSFRDAIIYRVTPDTNLSVTPESSCAPPSPIQPTTNSCWFQLLAISGPRFPSMPQLQSPNSGLLSLRFPCFYYGPSHPYIFVTPAPSSLSKHKAHNVMPLVAPWSPEDKLHVPYHAPASLAAFRLTSDHFLCLKPMLQELQPTCHSLYTLGYFQPPFFVPCSPQFARIPLLSHGSPPNLALFSHSLRPSSFFTSSREPSLTTFSPHDGFHHTVGRH